MNLGEKIVKIRKENKMSQEDFSVLFHVTRQTISSWENSKSYPDIETLIKISEKFNISLDILLKEDKKLVNQIDKKLKNNKRLKIGITILLGLLVTLAIITSWVLINNNMLKNQARKEEIKYNKIISNLEILGFKDDKVGYSSITEENVTYQFYKNMPQVLKSPYIFAITNNENAENIIIDYNGKQIAITYLSENKITVYCDKDGNLTNDKQNENYNQIFYKYQTVTDKIVDRLVTLFDEIYK